MVTLITLLCGKLVMCPDYVARDVSGLELLQTGSRHGPGTHTRRDTSDAV
jgi:hypothetical protein